MSEVLVRVDNVSRRFTPSVTLGERIAALLGAPVETRTVHAVDRVSLDIVEGEVLGLVGESGSGKSTTGRLLVGLETPSSGTIRIDGIDSAAARSRDKKAFHRQVQMIFQDPYGALNPQHTVEDLVGRPLLYQGVRDRAKVAANVRSVLAEVGLNPPESYLTKHPHQLSGGQRQRVCIARALLSKPDLLICDEIVSALDATVQMQVLHRLKTLQARLGFAMLFIGHDIEIVRWVSDEIAVMKDGRLVEHGPADRILHEPQQDYTRKLIAAMPTPLRLLS